MSTIYIDPTVAGTGTGTYLDPFKSWASVTWTAGNKYLQKAGTTFSGRVTVGADGTAGNSITLGAYDGATGNEITDQLGAAKIQSNADNSAATLRCAREYVTIQCLEITKGGSSTGVTSANVFAGKAGGNQLRFRYCKTNSGTIGLYIYPAQTDLLVEYCESSNHAGTGSNGMGMILEQNAGDQVRPVIRYNTFSNNTANGFYYGPYSAGLYMYDHQIVHNTITNCTGNGMRIVGECKQGEIAWNTCTGNLIGIGAGTFTLTGGSNLQLSHIHHNTLTGNVQFGIQKSGQGKAVIEYNNCSYNGANVGSKYGRGIEVVGSAGANRSAQAIVRYNICNNNYNYGGTLNNGTEGVGIGLDDYHDSCEVYGNIVMNNEGNGIQMNPNGAAGTNVVRDNLCIDNFDVDSTRASGWTAIIKSESYLDNTESNLKIYNNTFVRTKATQAGHCFAEKTTAAGTGVEFKNNVFIGYPIALKIRDAVTRTNNSYWNNTKNVERNTDTTTLGDGTGAVTADPKLSASYMLTGASPLAAAGVHLGYKRDQRKVQRPNPPSIGAYDFPQRTRYVAP